MNTIDIVCTYMVLEKESLQDKSLDFYKYVIHASLNKGPIRKVTQSTNWVREDKLIGGGLHEHVRAKALGCFGEAEFDNIWMTEL